MKGLPREAGGIGDPVFVRIRIATGGARQFESAWSARVNWARIAVNSSAESTWNPTWSLDGVAALRDGKIDARILKHPLGVVVLEHRRFGSK